MGQLDTRILSLYSRDSRQEKFNRLDDGQYYSFCYYDAIETVKAMCNSEGACPSLLSAYETAASDEGRLYASRQFLLAFADIREEDEQLSGGGSYYTEKEVQTFWEDKEKPVFFVTMVNLRDNLCLDEALSKIHNIFKGQQHLAYLTFDHCDLILFGRDNGFSDYANKIFQLNYGTDLVEDSITLYSFNTRAKVESDERFGVYLRFGIQDYAEAIRFVKDYEEPETVVGRLLGRNDMGLFNKDADMPWLKALIEKTLNCPQRWYTTYELSVLIQIPDGEPSWTAASGNAPKQPSNGIKERMDVALNSFLESYRNGPAGMEEDPVWTHWLSRTSALAVTLYEDRLAMDFGTCLVPQFLDLFSYADRLLRSKSLSPANRENVWDIFSAFFSSTSILMDSINHSSRQFVQVPSFGSVSFEAPPKLMAYYTAITHALIEVFRDDDYTYGVAFCPEFVSTLKVTSYADQDISQDEWLTISVGERSLYTLRSTTETLGHEISHFVGGDNRCRDVREAYARRVGLANLAAQTLSRICERLAKYCGKESPFNVKTQWSEIYTLVNKLMDGLEKSYLPEWSEGELFSRFLRNRLSSLPDVLLVVPDLTNTLEEWLYGLLLRETGEVMPLLAKRCAQKIGGPEAIPQESSQPIYRAMAKELIHGLLIQELKGLYEYYREIELGEEAPMYDGSAPSSTPDWICYMFSEAFADLQMILLFNLSWQDYQTLFLQDKTRLSAQDCPPRMLAVTRALVSAGKWTVDSVQTFEGPESLSHFGEAVSLNLFPEEHTTEADIGARFLQRAGFETDIIFYLSEYLKVCCKKIESAFQKPGKVNRVKELRAVHDLLSEKRSAYELEIGLIRFIDNYRSSLSSSPQG